MTLYKTQKLGVAHEEMGDERLEENLENLKEELGYELKEFENASELIFEFGVYGALEIMAEESDKYIFLAPVTDDDGRYGTTGTVIGAKVYQTVGDFE